MISISIIVFTCILSIYCFSNPDKFDELAYDPYKINHQNSEWFRFISHGFIHADYGHLFVNMLTMFFFASSIEGKIMSGSEFILFYLSAIIIAVLPSYQKHKLNPGYKAVGASGAVSSVVFLLVLYEPWNIVYLKFFIPIYFILYAPLFLIYSSYQNKKGTDNVAHDVHFWGALYGIAYALIFHPESLQVFLKSLQSPPNWIANLF
jgi:membrane associated rhomboid family serine protease